MPKKWKYSQEIYLKLNYGRETYKEMFKFLQKSEKTISYMAVRLGLSNKRNWTPLECIIALYYNNNLGLIDRNKNALKIKKCRLLKLYSN